MKVTEQVAAFAEPIVKEHGCALWDIYNIYLISA